MITSSGGLINILVSLLIAGLIIYAIYWFLDMLTLPEPIKTIAKVIVGILGLIWALQMFGVAI